MLKWDIVALMVSFHFRADEWDINKWAWEGVLKVVSKGENCSIRLEDKDTGEYSVHNPLSLGVHISISTVQKLKKTSCTEIDCAMAVLQGTYMLKHQ